MAVRLEAVIQKKYQSFYHFLAILSTYFTFSCLQPFDPQTSVHSEGHSSHIVTCAIFCTRTEYHHLLLYLISPSWIWLEQRQYAHSLAAPFLCQGSWCRGYIFGDSTVIDLIKLFLDLNLYVFEIYEADVGDVSHQNFRWTFANTGIDSLIFCKCKTRSLLW